MILKTYTRIFTGDIDLSLGLLRQLHGAEPHFRTRFRNWELAGIGDILLVGGTDEALAPIRGSIGPLIVDDIDRTRRELEAAGATITMLLDDAPTGRGFYARHPDGNSVEYVQWTPELVERWIEAPRRAGKLASQL